MAETIITKQEKDGFLNPQSRFIGDPYLQVTSKNRNVGQHRLYNHYKSLIQDIFNAVSLNKEYFTMMDGIFCYHGHTQIISILLSTIQCDHAFRLQSTHQNNIKSFIDHNYYKFDILHSNHYLDLFNDLSRNFSEENSTAISPDEVIETIYSHLNHTLSRDIQSQTLQLLTKLKSFLNHGVLNHKLQFEFMEWLLLIMFDIYRCQSIVQPLFDYQNNKPDTSGIVLTPVTKHQLLSSIHGMNEGQNDENYSLTCVEEKDDGLRIGLLCGKWIQVDIAFKCQEYKDTSATENIGENPDANDDKESVLISVQRRVSCAYFVSDDVVILECIIKQLVSIFVAMLIPHKLRNWNDLWIMIHAYVVQHIVDVQMRTSKENLSLADDNYLYGTQHKSIANATQKYQIPICSTHKPIAFAKAPMRGSVYRTILDDQSISLSLGELKAMAERQTDKILSETKEFVSEFSMKSRKWQRLNKKEHWMRFGAEKHQFIVLPKLVDRFKSHSRSLVHKAHQSSQIKALDDLVMTAIGLQSLAQLRKARDKETQKQYIRQHNNINSECFAVDYVEDISTAVPMIADIQYYNTCFAFHCSTMRNMESILAEGLKKGGDFIESTGHPIPVSHGSRWGTGVYLSCDYSLARYYAGTDYHERQAVLVNLVHLGRVHQLTANEVNAVRNFHDKTYSLAKQHRQQLQSKLKIWMQRFTLPCWQSSPGMDGVYKCGANTHISPDGKQIICGSGLQVLPVLQSTIQQRDDPDGHSWKLGAKTRSLRSVYADSKNYQWLNNIRGAKKKKKNKILNKAQKEKRKAIHFKKLCDLTAISSAPQAHAKHAKLVNVHDDLWTITLNEKVLSDVGLRSDFKMDGVKLLFGIDVSKSMKISKTYTKRVLPACAQMYRDLQPESTGAVFFGNDIEYHPLGSITTASKLLSEPFMKKKLHPKRNVLGCFEKLIDVVCNDYKQFRSEEKWDAYQEAKADLYEGYLDHVDLKEYNKDRAISTGNQMCKSMVHAMVSQAAHIGKLNIQNKKRLLLNRGMNEKSKHSRKMKDNMYVVVLFLCGNDTVNEHDAVERFFKTFNSVLKHEALRGIKIMVKIVALNTTNDNYYAALRFKYLLQTVSAYEPKPIYYASKKKLLSVVAKEVIQDVKLLSGTSNVHLQLPSNQCILDEGFVSNLTKSPDFSISLRLPPNGDYTVLYRGRPPSKICINDLYDVWCESDGCDEEYDHVLAMIQHMVSDLKIAVLAKRNVAAAVKIIQHIISVIKDQCLKLRVYDQELTVSQRIAKMKRNKQLISDLETVMNDITFIVDYSKTKQNITKKVEWISNIKKMKYGRQTMKRAAKYRDTTLNVSHILAQLLEIKQMYYLSNDEEGNEGEGSVLEEEYKQDEGAASYSFGIIKSECSKRSSWAHALDIFESLDLLLEIEKSLNFVDLLYGLGVVGIGIRVRRIEASNIDPWQLKVQYVSHCYNDSVSSMCALDSSLQVFETNAHAICTRVQGKHDASLQCIPDVMMVLNRMAYKNDYMKNRLLTKVMRSDLYSIYLATVFTRNPNLVIPSQKVAILMISLVQTVQQIFNNKDDTKQLINHALNIMYCVRLWIGNISKDTDGYWYGLIHKLYENNPGRFMTTSQAENVSSVCKVLAAICCFDESQKLFSEHHMVWKAFKAHKGGTNDKIIHSMKQKLTECQLSQIAIAMMGESTSRECRILVRNDADEMWRLIAKCLDIQITREDERQYNKWYNDGKVTKGIAFEDSFNMDKAVKASAKFFNYKLKTNCTPHGIVGCLGFTKCLYKFMNSVKIDSLWDLLTCDDIKIQNDLLCFIEKKFRTKKITMKSFIKHYLPSTNPLYVQIALYVQGLRYHTSKTRSNGLPQLIDPLPIIQKISSGYRHHTFEQYVKKRNKQMREKLEKEAKFNRRKRLLLEQNDFLLTHDYPETPKIFTLSEIKTLNASRNVNDQLELAGESGLLKHRCCFPKCTDYLVNLATEKDKIMNTRHGIWRHLRYLQRPNTGYYLKNCHVNAHRLLKREHLNKQQFKIKMKSIYKYHPTISNDHFDKTFDAIYHSFRCY
eukprot:72033_1